MQLTFGEFFIDTQTYELRRANQPVAVEPLIFDLISYFAGHPAQLLSKDDLIATVWQGRVVSDTTISTGIKNARKALGDSGGSQSVLQTVRGRGYRFIADVAVVGEAAESFGSRVATPRSSEIQEPSLLIVPLRCSGDDHSLESLAQSLHSDLNTILTRIPLLKISAQGDSYAMQQQPAARQVFEETGVDFVLDGSVQPGAKGGRVHVQLTDAKTGFRVWAEAFECSAVNAGSDDSVVSLIVGKLEPQLHRAMYDLVRSADGAPTARQLFLEASGLLVMQGWNHESFVAAGELLAASTDLDAQFAHAPALQSLLYGFGFRIGLAQDRNFAIDEARRTADLALQLDSMDSTILGLTGCSLADVGEVQRGEALLHAAIEANPANAQAMVALGALSLSRNDTPTAIDYLARGIAMSPVDSRLSVWGALLSLAYLLAGDLDNAGGAAQQACRRHDRTYLPRIALAAVHYVRRETDLAQQAMADARRIKADLSTLQIMSLTGKELGRSLADL